MVASYDSILLDILLIKYMLTRQERERFVLDLHNEGKNTREIAQIAHMSFRDIGFIIDKKREGAEIKRRTNTTGVSVYTSIQTLFRR